MSRGVLVLLLSTGCWPRIPGSYEDHAEAAETAIIGDLAVYEYLGGYWADGTVDEGLAWWAWLEPGHDVHLHELYAPAVGSCERDYQAFDPFDLAAPGSGTSWLIQGDEELELPSQDGDLTFAAAFPASDYRFDAEYALQVDDETEGLTPFFLDAAVRTPPRLTWVHPVVEQTDVPTLDDDDIVLEWTGSDADLVFVGVTLADSQLNTLESLSCVVPDTGSFDVPMDEFAFTAEAAYAILRIGAHTEGTGTIEGRANRMGATYWQHGAVAFP